MHFLRCIAFILPLFLLAHAQITSSQLLALLRSNNAIVTIELDPSKTCKNSLVECTDCYNGRICRPEDNSLVQIAKVQCLSESDTPYCNPNTGMCTSSPPEGCGTNKFICPPEDGAYPDPYNCSHYYLCANGVSTSNNCPKNNVYDHSTGQCKFRRRLADCVTINCAKRDGQVVVYPRDDRIWGRCVNGRALLLGRCKDYERYDVSQEKCVRVCRTTGNQPADPFKCQKYVYCAEVGRNGYESTELSCACNQGYDPQENRCTTTAPCLKELKTICGVSVTTKPKPVATTTKDDGGITEPPKTTKPPKPTEPPGITEPPNTTEPPGITEPPGTTEAPGITEPPSTTEPPGITEPPGTTLSRNIGPDVLIINNAGNANSGNTISNGNDNVDGNLVNGNHNGDNENSGNIAKRQKRSDVSPLIINNSGNSNSGNDVSNGADSVNGNLVNGNGNGDNSNSGNINNDPAPPIIGPLIINNSGNLNTGNNVTNGDDDVNGNLVNGNGNANNSNSGNINNGPPPPIVGPLIINNSGNLNNGNNVNNGNDEVNGNLVNGNENGDNSDSGNVIVKPSKSTMLNLLRIINNSGNLNSGNSVANGDDDVKGNLVNGNSNGNNANSGNVNNNDSLDRPKRFDMSKLEDIEFPTNKSVNSIKVSIDAFFNLIAQFILNLFATR